MRDFAVLFDPASVAVVGASDDPSKWGHAIARQALRAGSRRPVHLVNRRGGTVLGRPAARSLGELARPAPDERGARRMLSRLRGAALLGGVRGRPAANVGAVAAMIARFSRMVAAHPEIREMEINPLIAGADGALALVARVVLA